MEQGTGSRRRKRMEPISPILDQVLSNCHLRQGVANYRVFPRWPQIVGAHLAAQTRPLRVQGNVLWVHVDNSTLMHHLGFLQPHLLRRVREEAPGASIETIRFTLYDEGVRA